MHYRSSFFILLFGAWVLAILSCAQNAKENTGQLNYPAIIPQPAHMVPTGKQFVVTSATRINAVETLAPLVDYFQNNLDVLLSHIPANFANASKPMAGAIYFFLVDDNTLGDEGYRLDITTDSIQLRANAPQGIFRGIQTLNQIVTRSNAGTSFATATIRDVPRYSWRGAMLDVSRHFFSVSDVKRYIDLIAAYKINVLHLHLTDDQGWRLEIKSRPKLTAIGGRTQVGGGAGGFYTQEDYREIVRHAESRFITVVPEIDIPGHVNAALASYGELNCDGKTRPLYTGVEVGFSYLCPNEASRKFIADVLTEVAALTPDPFIHIGGDEVELISQADYINFIDHARAILRATGKRMIGWEEIGHAGLDGSDVAQHWNTPEKTRLAFQKQAKIILSPATITYLDMKYHSGSRIGHDWAALIDVDDTYNWNPGLYIKDLPEDQLLGIEFPLWTETVTSMDDIEFLAFPRLLSLAEVAWTPQEQRQWRNFQTRLAAHGPRMSRLGIDYYPSASVPWRLVD